MESHSIELYPTRGQVYIGLYRNVKNAPELRQRLVQQDSTLTCALVNACLVVNSFHVMLAVHRAIHDEQNDNLKSHNLYSEIVFDFSSTIHIAQSLRRFGIEDTTTDILAIKVGGDATEAREFMDQNIKGDLTSLDALVEIRDLKRIQKYYQTGDMKEDPDRIMQLVAGAMALKGL
ncbi:kinase binding protein CGI-121-domain-containing protein [Spinellus fusiger]|nr:kinase binding protein CGI-121-domain-containing protein [Spinellus fusiger]